jgi:hypothetical protein
MGNKTGEISELLSNHTAEVYKTTAKKLMLR